MLLLLELERDRADREIHSQTDLDGEAAGIVGEPQLHAAFARVDYAVEHERLVAHGLERAYWSLEVFAFVRLDFDRRRTPAVAHRNLGALAGTEGHATQFEDRAHHFVDA